MGRTGEGGNVDVVGSGKGHKQISCHSEASCDCKQFLSGMLATPVSDVLGDKSSEHILLL